MIAQEIELSYEKLRIKTFRLIYNFFKKGLLPYQQRYFMPHPNNKGICFFLYICMLAQQRFKKALYILVLKKDEPIPIGFILLRNFKKNQAELGIAISYHYQGKGYGSILLEKIISIAKERKIRKLVLSRVPSINQAEKLYSKFGFRHCGEKKIITLTFQIMKLKLMSLNIDYTISAKSGQNLD